MDLSRGIETRRFAWLPVGVLALGVVCPAAAETAWEDWQRPALYGASFESYAEGETLDSTKGTHGGTWGDPAVPTDAEATAVVTDSRTYLSVDTEETGLSFYPDTPGDRPLKSVVMRLCLSPTDTLPSDMTGAKSAFAAYAPAGGTASFVAWAKTNDQACGWVPLTLPSGKIAPADAGWCDLSVRFVKSSKGLVRIRYALKVGTRYESLVTEAGSWWLDAPDGMTEVDVSRIGLSGIGELESLDGSEPAHGLFVGLAPLHEYVVNESVHYRGTGAWIVYDSEPPHEQLDNPPIVGEAFSIAADAGQNYIHFVPKKALTQDRLVFTFALRFAVPDRDEEDYTSLCAAVKLVQENPVAGMTDPEPTCRFAYLVDGKMVVNSDIAADPDSDYTVEVTLDKTAGTVAYRVKSGRGGNAGRYQDLGAGKTKVFASLQNEFHGHGFVYDIKAE